MGNRQNQNLPPGFEVVSIPDQTADSGLPPGFEVVLQEKPSELKSAGLGAAQGATFGFADEIEAYAKELPFIGDPEKRKKLLEGIRREYELAQETNPWSYGTGDVVGSIASGVLTGAGGARLIGKTGLSGAKALAARLGQGGVEAAASGYGRSDKEGMEALKDAGTAGATGLAFGAGLEAVSKGLQKGGRALYNQAFKKVDRVAKKYNKEIVPSELAWKHKLGGSAEQIEEQVDDKIKDLVGQRTRAAQAVDDAGGVVDITKATAEAKSEINKLLESRSSIKKRIGNRMNRFINDVVEEAKPRAEVPDQVIEKEVVSNILDMRGQPIVNKVKEVIPGSPPVAPANVSQTMGITSDIYENIADESFQKLGRTTAGNRVLKKFAQGVRNEYEKVAGAIDPAAAQKIKDANKELSTLLTIRKAVVKDADREAGKLGVTQIDALSAAAGPQYLAAKLAGKALTSSKGQTRIGRGAFDMGVALPKGKTGGALRATERSIFDMSQEKKKR